VQFFWCADPESVEIQLSDQYFFTLSGSAGVKVLHRMLMKVTPGVDFTNILRKLLCPQIPKAQKDTCDLTVFLCFWDLHL
jgi:hypothetical protein